MKSFSLFNNKPKGTNEPEQHTEADSSDADRQSLLSDWGATEAFTAGKEQPKYVATEFGFIFCRKCYEVISERETKCPYCGYANKRN